MSNGDLAAEVKISVSGFEEAHRKLDAADTAVAKLARGCDAAGKPLGGLIANLKQLAQVSSGITGVIGGLAALGGVKMAADAIANLSKQALKLKADYQSEKISASEFNDEMARAVPIAGSLYSAVVDGARAVQDYAAWAAKAAGASDQFAKSLESTATRAEQAKANLKALQDLRALSQGLKDAAVNMGGDEWDSKFAAARGKRNEAEAKAIEIYQEGINPTLAQKKAGDRLKAALAAGTDENLAREQYKREMDSTLKTKPEAELRRERDKATALAQANLEEEEKRILQEREMAQRTQMQAWGRKLDPNSSVNSQYVDEVARRQHVTDAEMERGATPGVDLEIEKRIEEMAKSVTGYTKEAFDAERQKFAEAGASRGNLFSFDGAGDEWRRRSLGARRDARGVSQGLDAGVESALGALGSVGGSLGEVKKRYENRRDDFAKAMQQAQEAIDFQGMTPEQVQVERFRRSGVSNDKLAKLEALQANQEKRTAGTQMLSSQGVQDYVQQAIGNAPMQKQTLVAAEKTATASEKTAACVRDGSLQVIVKSMPAQVAVLG